MQKRILILGFISFLFITLPTQAAILFSTSFDAWQNDMTTTFSRHLDHATFKTNYQNISPTVSSSFSALPNPSNPDYQSKRTDWNNIGNNVDLGRTAVFNKANTNFKWSFEVGALETHKVKNDHGTQYSQGDVAEAHVFYNDRVKKGVNTKFEWVDAFTDVLSIGKFGGFDTKKVADGDPFKWDNDDFSIEITSGPDLYALAFEIVNNKKQMDFSIDPDKPKSSDGGLYSYGKESVTVIDSNKDIFKILEKTGGQPVIPGYYDDPATPDVDEGAYNGNFDNVQFIGIVSDTPFDWLEFNEDSRSDDIGIKNLMFAGNVAPVPLPAGVWLLASGLIALFGLGKQKRSV